MKRSREVTILVNALIQNGLLEESKSDRARCVIKMAIKEIRKERYAEKSVYARQNSNQLRRKVK